MSEEVSAVLNSESTTLSARREPSEGSQGAAELSFPVTPPKRKRGRPRKNPLPETQVESASKGSLASQVPSTSSKNAAETKLQQDPAQVGEPASSQKKNADQDASQPAAVEAPAAEPRRRRGRPRKKAPESYEVAEASPASSASLGEVASSKEPASKNGRDASFSAEYAKKDELSFQESAQKDQPQETAASEGSFQDKQTFAEASQDERGAREYKNKQKSEKESLKRKLKSAERENRSKENEHNRDDRFTRRNNTFAGRRQRRRKEPLCEPTLTKEELLSMKIAELRLKAQEFSIPTEHLKKQELVDKVYEAAAVAEGFCHVKGILEIQSEGYGFLRSDNYLQGDNDAFVWQPIIKQYQLRPGDEVEGSTAPNGRSNTKYPPLHKIFSINGRDPETVKNRARFKDLTPVYPNERLLMENGSSSLTGRAIDLVAPIGKGQRGLIVSPPKAGKTTILKRICASIAANNPEVHLICLLVDERPEEVTDMQRCVKGTVVASTFDMPAENHTAVAELVIEHAKRLVELGEDVCVVLDSITRLARAYNLAQPASGRVLSGGVDSAALYPPKRFLGAARNIEFGGSLTILASALIDTGSKMDEVIFEEFKGTGNMELKLDRDLADKRIFPAIDPVQSGTRNEELLISEELRPFVWGIRRILANMNNTERAETALVKGLKSTKNNEEFLIRSAKKAQAEEHADAL